MILNVIPQTYYADLFLVASLISVLTIGILGIVLLMVVLPVLLNIVISEFMRRKKWIKFGDMKLPD